jgi:hypothetical protein
MAMLEDNQRVYYGRAHDGEWFVAFSEEHEPVRLFEPSFEHGYKWNMLVQMAWAEGEPLVDHPYGITMVPLRWVLKDGEPEWARLKDFFEANPPIS